MLKEKVLFEKVIDLGGYGDFTPDIIEYEPETSFATLYGEYTPIGGDTLKAVLYVEFERPVEEPLDILDMAWIHREIAIITIED